VAIGDIAGRYLELMEMLRIIPKGVPLISLGDISCRGSRSKEAIQFFIQQKDCYALDSNHGYSLVNFWNGGDVDKMLYFLYWGGIRTLESYGVKIDKNFKKLINLLKNKLITKNKAIIDYCYVLHDEFKKVIPEEHILFLRNLPLFIETDEVLLSHAPFYAPFLYDIKKNYEKIISYKGIPERSSKIQIHGHIPNKNIAVNDNLGTFAYNIDTSLVSKLTAIHWPSKNIYQVDYLSE
jgi:hypothetical protein